VLASEVTRLVRGEQGLQTALRATRVMFGEEPPSSLPLSGFSCSLLLHSPFSRRALPDCGRVELLAVMKNVPSGKLPRGLAVGQPLVAVLRACRLVASNREARQLIKGGGVYVNSRRTTEEEYCLSPEDLVGDHFCVLRVGKKVYFLLEVTDDAHDQKS